MIPAALATAFYLNDLSHGYQSYQNIEYYGGDNVVNVDFGRKSLPRSKVVDDSLTPEWKIVATERLHGLQVLPDGWDGEGSRRISDAAIMKAGLVLKIAFPNCLDAAPPAAVPCADGSLQLEWWLADTRFELSIDADGNFEAWALDRISGHESEALGPDAIALLSRWSNRLTADKLAQFA